MRALFILSFFILASCSGRGQGRSAPSSPSAEGDAIRISYLRYNPSPQEGTYRPHYLVLLSYSWRETHGDWYETHGATKKDPFRHIYSSPFLNESVPDKRMITLFNQIMNQGFDALQHREPKTLLSTLAPLSSEKDTNRIMAHRIISVERGDYKKTVLYADVLGPGYSVNDLHKTKAFTNSEIAIMRFPESSYAVQVQKQTMPLNQKHR